MIRRLFQSRLFLRYMLSYLTILLLPLILLTVLIYQSAVRNLRTEIERSHLNQLTQARVTVDARIRELSDIASRIAYDNRLTRYRVHDPYFSSEAIAALDQYKATSSIIGELFLYFHGDERIYSSTGLSSLDVFQSKYSFAGWDKEQVRQDLNTAAFPFMRPADRVMRNGHIEQSMLAYVVPVTPNNPNPHGTLLYLIEEGEFNGLIRSILGSYQGLTYVFDNKGQVLTANRQGETLSAEETRQLFEQPGGIHSLVLGGSRHSVVSVKSDLNGWTYTTVMPSSQFFSRVAHVRSMMILLFTLVGLIGVFASLLLARRQYSPISQLAEFASSAFKAPAGRGSRASDELEHIRRVLRESSQRAGLQEPYARNHYLLMLLKYGGSESLTPDLLEAFQLRFDRRRYAVLVLEWEGPHDRAEAPPSLPGGLADLELPALAASLYAVELPEPNRFAFIAGFDPAEEEAEAGQLRRVVEAAREHAEGQLAAGPSIGVGTVYPGPGQLNESYIEACSAFEFRLSTGPGGTSFFAELSDAPGPADWLPPSLLLKLTQSLKQGSYDVAVPVIREALSFLQTSGAAVPLMRCMSYDLLNAMLKTASELGLPHSARDIPSVTAFSSLEELEESFLQLASRICSQAELNAKTEERTLMDRIVAYIDQHYGDHALSLESISHEYSISPSHFSRSFKEKVGLNFTQYVWQKRVEEVKRQLAATSDPLKDIIVQVGYWDAPNFIRKFKKETGLTPGQYRKQYAPDPAVASFDEEDAE